VARAQLSFVPLADVVVSDENVRKHGADSDLEELEESIRTNGLLQPVVVVRKGSDKFDLIIGQRRFLAIKKLEERGLWAQGDLAALVYDHMDIPERISKSLTENLERKNLSFSDTCNAVALLMKEYHKVAKVARELGVSQPTVYKYIKNEKLPSDIKQLVDSKSITQTDARRAMAAAGGDPEKALAIAHELPKLRADQKVKLVSIGASRQDTSAKDLVREAKTAEREFRVTIILPRRSYNTLLGASEELKLDVESTASRAIVEWLRDKGYDA